MFFANAELFHDRVLDAVATSPTPVRWLVVAAEPVTSVDVTSADMLAELDETLHAAGIELCFAEMDPVKDKLKRSGVFARLGEETFLPTLGAAVERYLRTHTVDWWTRAHEPRGQNRMPDSVLTSCSNGIIVSARGNSGASVAAPSRSIASLVTGAMRMVRTTSKGRNPRHRAPVSGYPSRRRHASATRPP